MNRPSLPGDESRSSDQEPTSDSQEATTKKESSLGIVEAITLRNSKINEKIRAQREKQKTNGSEEAFNVSAHTVATNTLYQKLIASGHQPFFDKNGRLILPEDVKRQYKQAFITKEQEEQKKLTLQRLFDEHGLAILKKIRDHQKNKELRSIIGLLFPLFEGSIEVKEALVQAMQESLQTEDLRPILVTTFIHANNVIMRSRNTPIITAFKLLQSALKENQELALSSQNANDAILNLRHVLVGLAKGAVLPHVEGDFLNHVKQMQIHHPALSIATPTPMAIEPAAGVRALGAPSQPPMLAPPPPSPWPLKKIYDITP